ncbi:hypothetical protein L7F22_041478 [Adiantum nelumboides]|nr:hypothetical protein [Adiantum nelumboides]
MEPLPRTANGKLYILVAIDYMTRWVEAQSVAKVNEKTVSKFVYTHICRRFGTPLEIVSDNGPGFRRCLLKEVCEELKISHRHSTPYYPQSNGLVEKANGIIARIIRKMVESKPKRWDNFLDGAIWAYRTTYKDATQFTPFHLVYGQEALQPIELNIPTIKLTGRQEKNNDEAWIDRLLNLVELEWKREAAYHCYKKKSLQLKDKVNEGIKDKEIKEKSLVLRYNNALDNRFDAKFERRKEGPFIVKKAFTGGYYQLMDLNGKEHPRKVNGYRLKPYLSRILPAVFETKQVSKKTKKHFFGLLNSVVLLIRLTICGKFDFLAANMSCGSSGRSKVFSRVKMEDEPSLERLQVVRNEGIGGEDHGLTADTINLKPAATSVDVPVTATKVMIGTEWLENKVQDLSAVNAQEEKVEEEEAEGNNVEEEAEQQELADANKDIAEVLEDLSSQGFSSAELDLGDNSPLGHFHKVLASRKGRVHLGSRSSPTKKWKPSAVDCSAEAEMHVVWMSKIYCLFAATPHPQQFLVRFNQLNLPIAVEDGVLVLILRPLPPVKKKKRKRQKPAVPIEEIVIDHVPLPLQIDLSDLNQCPPPLANDPRVLILDLNGVLLSHFWPAPGIFETPNDVSEATARDIEDKVK